MSKTFENNAQKALDMASGIRQHSSSSQAFGYRIRIFDISRHLTTFAFGYHNRSGKKA